MIIGHQKQLAFLRDSLKAEKASHAYLFSGPAKIGKKTLALFWLTELLQKNNHPDLVLVNSEQGEDEIKIAKIRDLIWKLSLKPHSADFKAALVDDAHLMNTEAQNALLKTLEEPKGSTFIFLVTDRPEYLLPTIVSRVQTVKFYPLSDASIKDFLKDRGISEDMAEEMSKLSFGRPGIAADFAADPSKIDSIKKSLEDIKKISESDLWFRFQYAKAVSEDLKSVNENLDIWLGYFRNILLGEASQKERQKYSLPKLKNIINSIQQTKQLISSTNVNMKLALELLMLAF